MPLFQIRTLTPSLIGGALAFGAFMTLSRSWIFKGVAATGLLGAYVLTLTAYYNSPSYEDWRGLGEQLGRTVSNRDAVVVCRRTMAVPLSAYWDLGERTYALIPTPAQPLRLSKTAFEQLSGSRQIPTYARGGKTQEDILAYFDGPNPKVTEPTHLKTAHDSVFVVEQACDQEIVMGLKARLKALDYTISGQPAIFTAETNRKITVTEYSKTSMP